MVNILRPYIILNINVIIQIIASQFNKRKLMILSTVFRYF